MKIDNKMIDKQLRMPAKIAKLFMGSLDKDGFKRLHKMSSHLVGKNFKGLKCSEKWITRGQDGTDLRVCIYKPLSTSESDVGVFWMHGGGYAMNVPESSIELIRKFIDESGCTVVAPDYRLSVDAPYPAALDDCHEALQWMKNHAIELGVSVDKLMVGGESAGGGLAAALSLYERDHGGIKIAFQMLLYPMLDDRMTSESAKDNNAPVWNSDSNKAAWELYLGGLSDEDVPIYAAPARATDFSNLPPAVTFVGSLEPFRDETISYVKKLREAGVPVAFKIYEGCYHAFDRMNPHADVSLKAISFLMKEFKNRIMKF